MKKTKLISLLVFTAILSTPTSNLHAIRKSNWCAFLTLLLLGSSAATAGETNSPLDVAPGQCDDFVQDHHLSTCQAKNSNVTIDECYWHCPQCSCDFDGHNALDLDIRCRCYHSYKAYWKDYLANEAENLKRMGWKKADADTE